MTPNDNNHPARIRVGCDALFADALLLHAIILGMSTDPVPQDALLRFDSYGTVMIAHSYGPMSSDLLEV